MRLKLFIWEKENGYTGRYVAKKLHISESAWSKVKHGKQDLTYEQLQRFRKEFNLNNVLELLEEE